MDPLPQNTATQSPLVGVVVAESRLVSVWGEEVGKLAASARLVIARFRKHKQIFLKMPFIPR